MSNESGGVAGSDDGRRDTTRVGNAEREQSIALLAEHWRAGRLDPAEHERRVTKARQAVTKADLDALFADLPLAGPAPATTGPVSSGQVSTGPVSSGPVVSGTSAGFLGAQRDTIMALTPFAALILFFVTGYWLWFLAIPVMGILLYGPEGRKKSGPRGHRSS